MNLMVISCSDQSILYKVVTIHGKVEFYCTVVYGENKGKERRALWEDLQVQKRFVNSKAWVMMGDLNVGLTFNDSNVGTSHMTRDMIEFEECINNIEMEDLNSSGMNYTWTQKMLNPIAGMLKKSLIGLW